MKGELILANEFLVCGPSPLCPRTCLVCSHGVVGPDVCWQVALIQLLSHTQSPLLPSPGTPHLLSSSCCIGQDSTPMPGAKEKTGSS